MTLPATSVNKSKVLDARKRKTGRHSASLVDALFTSTQQRVLALLFGQPNRSFFVTELVGLTESGSGAVQRELARLAQGGLVTVTKVGNQKHYQANEDSPLFEELCNIIEKTVGLQEPIRGALEPLAGRIKLALIYGSIAKQSDTSASDIDLLLVSDNLNLEEIYAALAPVEKLLDRSINPTLYTAAEIEQRRKSKNSFLTRVLDGPTIVLIGDDDGTCGTRQSGQDRQTKSRGLNRPENRGLVRSGPGRRILDKAHRKQNIAEFEGNIDINEQSLEILI
jgi:predicted nucleotidyltransferase